MWFSRIAVGHPTAVVSLFSLPCKTLKLLPVIQVALKEKVYVLPPTKTVKTVDTSTDFCLLWSILQALLLSLLFIFGQSMLQDTGCLSCPVERR